MAWETIVLAGAGAFIGAAFFFFWVSREFTDDGFKGIFKPLFFLLSLFSILAAFDQVREGWDYQGVTSQVNWFDNFWIASLTWVVYFLILATIIDTVFWIVRTFFRR